MHSTLIEKNGVKDLSSVVKVHLRDRGNILKSFVVSILSKNNRREKITITSRRRAIFFHSLSQFTSALNVVSSSSLSRYEGAFSTMLTKSTGLPGGLYKILLKRGLHLGK